MSQQNILLILTIITGSSASAVKWLPDTSFDLSINYRFGKLPCSKETVIFEDSVDEPVQIKSENHIGGIVLPKDGEFLLTGTLILGADENDSSCSAEDAFYKSSLENSWIQPDVWASNRFNEATPDAERRPCYDDTVEIPEQSSFGMRLPDQTQYVDKITELEFPRNTKLHYYILNKFYQTGIVQRGMNCPSRAGCPCQKDMTVDCSPKHCQIPKCEKPVQPVGHCCHICGGFLTFKINMETFDLMTFKDAVAKAVDSYGAGDLVYHIGRLPDDKVQVVVVEKEEYKGTSAEVLSEIKSISKQYGDNKVVSSFSGSPLSQAGKDGKIAVSMFFLVVLVMAGIYVYYYRMPEIQFPIVFGGVGRTMVSRFNRRTDSVVSLTSRRDSGAVIPGAAGTAFRNPLYDSKRGRVQMTDTTVDEE